MLPLWIIDLTQTSDRRTAFVSVLSKVKGVMTSENDELKELSQLTQEFHDSYEDDESSKQCLWFYSRIKAPYFGRDSFNVPYTPTDEDQLGCEEEYFKALIALESEANHKIKSIEAKEEDYRKKLLEEFNKDFQQMALKEGQSFIGLLSSTIDDVKNKTKENKEPVYNQELLNNLCQDFKEKIDNEGKTFSQLLTNASAEAEQKATKNAKTFADAKAKVMEERTLAFNKSKYEKLYEVFQHNVQKQLEALETKFAKITAESKNTDNDQQNEDILEANKQLLDELYKEFQGNIINEGRVFTKLLLESMNSSESKILEDAKARMLEKKETAYHAEIAEKLYNDFQEKVVQQGKIFIDLLKRTRGHAYATINICVIGDSTEEFSRLVFPSVAVMLQKEKGRIFPSHIHQGMNILGAFYIPSDVNALKVDVRNKIRRTLEEIDVQHNISTVQGYDKMLYYQDVQCRTGKFYPLLSSKSQAEYLVQCLISLYYACSEVHPLLDGVYNSDSFYIAMGAAAVYYDSDVQEEEDKCNVAKKILDEFLKNQDKKEVDEYFPQFTGASTLKNLIDTPISSDDDDDSDDESSSENRVVPSNYNDEVNLNSALDPQTLVKAFKDNIKISIDKVPSPELDVDPINEFWKKPLKKRYFLDNLRFQPPRMQFLVNKHVADNTRDVLEVCSIERKKMSDNFNIKFTSGIRELLRTCTTETGALERLERNVEQLKNNIGELHSEVDKYVENHIWKRIIMDYSVDKSELKVPKNLQDTFDEYHGAYQTDIRNHSPNYECCYEKKRSAMEAYKHNLSKETPLLSRLARNFLQSLVTAIAMVPTLKLLSPEIIDLGDIYAHGALWATIMFMIPVLIQAVSLWLYYRKRKHCENNLKAMFLHDAYARTVNKAYSEIKEFYESAMATCDKYLERFTAIRKELKPDEFNESNLELPNTRFCQRLLGGKFYGESIMGEQEVEPGIIRVRHTMKKPINQLDPEDTFSLIRGYSECINNLLQDFNTNAQNPNVPLSKENIKENLKAQIKTFKKDLYNNIQKDLIPRESPTVGEKLLAYYDRYIDDKNKQTALMLKPLIDISSVNGEFVSSADKEYTDVKSNNPRIEQLAEPLVPTNFSLQPDTVDSLFKRYLFITRWSTFEYVWLNRILPLEDFDMESRCMLVSEKNDQTVRNLCYPSSLFLMSISQIGTSRDSQWLRLFPERIPSKSVWTYMKAYQDRLNEDD